jgi:ribonuclease R
MNKAQGGKDGKQRKHVNSSQIKTTAPSLKAVSPKKLNKTTIGIVRVNSYGTGFVDQENKEEKSTEIPTQYLHTATHLDEVEIAVTGRKTQRGNPEGEVVKILKRAKTSYTGVIENKGMGLCLITDDKRLYADIYIPQAHRNGAVAGDKAHVEIVEWTKDERNPIGKVLEVVGKHGEHEAEIRAILLERGIMRDFPSSVEEEAKKVKEKEKKTSAEEIKTRRDMRGTLTFTIDPFDAKDFDDAISFKELPDGTYEIGVHIADVSHYVRPGTELDREARERGFSVYLVDRTIPMLPEILSNDLCSLNPHEDKLAFSSIFIMNKKGEVLSRWFGKTIINSDRRFTYEEAQESIVKSGDYDNELRTLNGIAKILREKKERAGAIDFEQDEIKFVLDEKGKPIRIIKKKRFDAHKLVEEYMLLANREVAMFMAEAPATKAAGFLYRIHDVPKDEKIADLAIFVRALGHELPISKKGVTVRDLQALMKKVEGKAEESLVKTAAVRSMAKAIYSTDNVGHFGLAFEYYTHFTSPIRRYADLVVHRLLQDELTHSPKARGDWELYKKVAEDTSEKEIRAAEAERASIKYKQVEYMKDRIGQVFDGSISGVTEWGVYVEDVETKSEGMIRLKDLPGDYYVLDKKNYAVVGERTKKKYRLGDKVKFKILNADLERKTLDFTLVG